MDDVAFEGIPAYNKRSYRRPRGFVFIVIFILLLLILAFIGIRLLGAQNENEQQVVDLEPSPTATIPTPIPTSEVTPTQTNTKTTPTGGKPSPTKTAIKTGDTSRNNISVEVLNGSGTAGAAKAVASSLEKLGYTISRFGNADSFEYKNITISVKSTKSELLSLLKNDLSSDYIIGSTSAKLPSTSSSDAVIIIGKE